ncbi:MAG: glycosyltransferase family 2 protein [Gammaproteobacteria bacterium]|nr:glycosyltransferase family 2 protein [Gammaproteobacteria bacterium]
MIEDADRIVSRSAAIVVTYHPDVESVAKLVDSLCEAFPEVIVVDNSDDAAIRASLSKSLDARSRLVSMDGNAGIGAAQNCGINEASSAGCEYFVTFDQDSVPEAGFLGKLVDAYVEASQTYDIAAIGPRALDAETGKAYAPASSSTPLVVERTLSSGLLLTRRSLDIVGPMDEALFIDLVDWDWCFRARANGLVVMMAPSVILEHRLGERHTRIVGAGNIGTPQPWRHYYGLRNYLLLCRRRYVPPSWWKAKYFAINLFKLLAYPVFMESGGERLHYMLEGIRDGLAGRSGPR